MSYVTTNVVLGGIIFLQQLTTFVVTYKDLDHIRKDG